MAIASNTFQTYAAVGNREQLADIISNISPTDTVFQNSIGKTTAENVKFEWQTDSLATPDTTNLQIEGDDLSSYEAVTATVRLNNYCQVSRKSVVISGTQEAVNKAGRKSELAYQLTKKTKELKRDMEALLCYNLASSAGTASTARQSAGLRAWIKTNTSITGTNGGFGTSVVSVATDGTQRALSETLVKNVLRQCFNSGGEPDLLMAGPFNKQVLSGFTGNNTRFQDTSDGTLATAIDVYKSDYGSLKIMPNRFQRERDLFAIQTDKWKIAWLRPINVVELATTGDAKKRLLIGEYGLMSMNEAASGVVADLTTS